jgi:3-deoxy-D-manno-octulosonic-acid transferase
LSIIQHGITAKVIKQIAPDATAVEINNFFKTKNKKVFEENLNKFFLMNKNDEKRVIQLISKYF